MYVQKAKKSRFEIRLSSQEKQLIGEAAGLSHLDLSNYARHVLVGQAQKDVVETRESFILSNKDRDKFMASLTSYTPNQALKDAAKTYQKTF